MSEITLSVLRCPDSVVPEQRRAKGGEISLGRGVECDWQLADPDRVLSKKHCVLEYFGGSWRLRDTSTNGTFVNHAAAPVGRDQVRPLMNGDRLRLGAYEIEVQIAEAEAAPSPGWGGTDPFKALPLEGNPFADPSPGFGTAPLASMAPPAARGGGLLPHDFDPFGDTAPPMPDHAPATAEAFMVPPSRPVGQTLIPDDWDLDLKPEPSISPPLATPPPSMPPASMPAPVAAAPLSGNGTADSATGLVLLLEGAGLPPVLAARALNDPDATLRSAGALLRAAIACMRALLIARADVKREFRIEQTMLRAGNNSPLKFAATDEQALSSLLDPRTPALSAMQEAVDDLIAHQVAALAATQTAARALLDRLAPGPLEAEDTGSSLMPGAKERRLWEAYKRRHAQLEQQFEDDFDSAFGKAFARAYEQATGRKYD